MVEHLSLMKEKNKTISFSKHWIMFFINMILLLIDEFGLYEAHVEGMWPSNSMIIGGCGD